MDFIFYYVFRRFFISVDASPQGINLRKGLILRRICFVPASVIVSVQVRRTPLLRLLHGRKITVSTLSGKISFYLRDNESLAFLPPRSSRTIRPKWGSVMLGAFCETRALGGTVVFSATLSRIGSIFGSGYYNSIIGAINKTAEGLSRLLSELRIAVPRITTVLAVFVAAAWVFAFARNLLRLSRFTVDIGKNCITTSHGILTLYEQTVISNNLNAAIVRSTAVSLLFNAAPLYCNDILLCLPLNQHDRRSFIHCLLKQRLPARFDITPEPNAVFGHIAVPFGWGLALAAVQLLCYIRNADPILNTLLWGGIWICAWLCILFGIYMRYSGVSERSSFCIISARRGTHLYTACIPHSSTAYRRTDTNLFQLRQKQCDLRIYCRGQLKLRLRNIRSDHLT